MRIFRRIAFVIGCAAVLAVASSTGMFVYGPLMAEQQSLDRDIASTEAFLSSQARLEKESQQLQKYLSEMERHFEEAVTRIPESARETEFLGQLSDLAATSGLQMLDFRPVGVVERSGYQELAINISSKGDYTSLCTFLYGLRNLDRLCQVTSLNVTGNAGATKTYPSTMTVAVFFAPLNSKSGTGANDDNS